MHKHRRLVYYMLICICIIISTTHGAVASVAPKRSEGPVTIQTKFQLPTTASEHDRQALVLTGLASRATGFPDVLSLVWSEQESAWLPTWSLQLHSRNGLLPKTNTVEQKASLPFNSRYVDLANVAPELGHTYNVVLSYHPGSGALSIQVIDLDTKKAIYKEQFALEPYFTDYYMSAGYVQVGTGSVDDRYLSTVEPSAVPTYIPQAVTWGLVQEQDGQPESLVITRLDRTGADGVGIRLQVPAKVEGEFRFYLEKSGVKQQLTQIVSPEDDEYAPLNQDLLPVGSSTLIMEYYADGKQWLSETQQITIGKVEARVSALGYDEKTGYINGTLTLAGDGDFPDTPVKLVADLAKMEWDVQRNHYQTSRWNRVNVFHDTLKLTKTPLEIAFSLPPVGATPGLWQAQFSVEVGVDTSLIMEGADRLFGTYRTPQINPDEPFSIAVLPDTQYYSLDGPQGGHPDMFVRQAQWIAENAEQQKIALVLHLGDITQMNANDHWQVAQKSLNLLDGVVPYVLSIGNHDLGDQKGESRDTKLNRYFPVSYFQELPSFGGLYQPEQLENSYHHFHLGGQDYLVISLEFLPRDPVLDWANDVVAAHPNSRVILITHTYTGRTGTTRTAYGATPEKGILDWGEVSTGYEIWNKFVRKHPNIFMILSGHIHHDAVPRQIQVGLQGNPVYEMLFDYQLSQRGGDGWMALLNFQPKQARIDVSVFSPTSGKIKVDNSDGFYVPFAIDLANVKFIPANLLGETQTPK